MITVGMNYQVIEGKGQEFEDKFAAVMGALEGAEGHTTSALYKDVADALSYLIVSEWSSEDAFTGFIRSDDFRAVTDWGKEQILSDRPRHKVYKN
jgi:heme-degrading monooxygenase HmoA